MADTDPVLVGPHPTTGAMQGARCLRCDIKIGYRPYYNLVTPQPGNPRNSDVRAMCEECAANVGPAMTQDQYQDAVKLTPGGWVVPQESKPVDPRLVQPGGTLTTKTGKVLTDDDIQALADEAEQGYDVEHLKAGPRRDHQRRRVLP
jgi:hypothetical protein